MLSSELNFIGPKAFTYFIETTTGFDPDARIYFIATGITDPGLKIIINAYVIYLKTNNLWDREKTIHPMVTDKINTLVYTEAFANAVYWPVQALSAVLSIEVPPAGVSSCYNLIPDVSNSQHYTTQITSVLGNEGLTISFFVKPSGYNWVRFAVDFTGQFYRLWFDAQNGVFGSDNGTATLISKKATNAGNGWWRVEMTLTSNQPYGALIFIAPQTADNETTFIGDGVSGIIVCAAQMELSLTDAAIYEPVLAGSVMAAQMAVNLKSPGVYDLIWFGRWGYCKNGANPYPLANTYAIYNGLFPNVVLNQNNVALGYYSRTNAGGPAAFNFEMGIFQGVGSLHLGISYALQGTRARINSTTPTTTYFPISSVGYFFANRIVAGTVKIAVGGLVVDTEAIASDGLGALEMVLGALGSVGPVYNQYSQKQCALANIGGGFTDAELLLIYTGGQNMNTSLNRQV